MITITKLFKYKPKSLLNVQITYTSKIVFTIGGNQFQDRTTIFICRDVCKLTADIITYDNEVF